ncbi:MAG: hypothetical protein FWF76_03780 [Oscillospiraceae bacterium]|nr:hypothetical protein [Oscillospiraceae bacterium]
MQIMPLLTNPYYSSRNSGNANSVSNLIATTENNDNSGGITPSQPSLTEIQENTLADALAEGCHACNNRRYQDVSSDGSVSMQTPTQLSPSEAAVQVPAHEMEHLANDRLDAEMDGREIVAQWMRLTNAICAECGIIYISGGEAVTISATTPTDMAERFNPGIADTIELIGAELDLIA